MSKKRDVVEIFGYSSSDLTITARSLWGLGACPFTYKGCIKINHNNSITYGTCSVTSAYGDIIICPNRLYADNYESIRNVAHDAFGSAIPFYMFDEYIKNRMTVNECVVALGKNSGKEVQVGQSLSMDWILAKVKNGELEEYIGIEVQSIDITGNYREAWHGYKNITDLTQVANNPSSQHGLNWANVHKRLIPQLIRKGRVYSKSDLVNHGLYFVVPEIVYKKFEDLIGEIPTLQKPQKNSITVCTYELGGNVAQGQMRTLNQVRTIRFLLEDFANSFISGQNLPDGLELDNAVKNAIGLS